MESNFHLRINLSASTTLNAIYAPKNKHGNQHFMIWINVFPFGTFFRLQPLVIGSKYSLKSSLLEDVLNHHEFYKETKVVHFG